VVHDRCDARGRASWRPLRGGLGEVDTSPLATAALNAHDVLRLQRHAGNNAVARLLGGAGATVGVQRAPSFGTGVGGQPMYGIGPARKAYVQELIDANDFQTALSAMVDFLEEDSEIDRSLLRNGTMVIETGLPDHGAVSPPGFVIGSWPPKAEPCNVRIGLGAFSSVAYLHSVMMHEYQHVLGYQTQAGQQQTARGIAEVSAYAWEILNAALTGLGKEPSKVATQWEHLAAEFALLNKPDAKQILPLANKAQQAARSIVGRQERLTPLAPI
jgi:hypothetical protein